MSWYYADNGRQAGPIDDATLDNMIRLGSIGQETLVWKEGMGNWQPLGTVRPMAAPPPPAAPAPQPPMAPAAAPLQQQPQQQAYTPPAPQNDPFAQIGAGIQQAAQSFHQGAQQAFGQPQGQGVTCANCGQMFSMNDVVYLGNGYVCAGCKPAYMQRMREGGASAVGPRRYGGFWIRFVAILIDGLILGIAGALISFPVQLAVGAISDNPMSLIAISGLLQLVQMAGAAAYMGYFLSTKGATIGKQVMGLKVIRSDGSPITFQRGVGRYFASMVSALILGLGYIIAAFDAEKRTLHDYICDTRVISIK
ncbi:MAG: RDD family protein [Acidobacteria bacterium]|nr:RDD family protein [Acidobacteriota bacterium]